MNRREKTEPIIQNPEPRLKNANSRSFVFVLCSVFLVLSLSSSAFAWSPEDVLKSYLMNNYPWEEILVSKVKILGEVPAETPESIIVKSGPIGKSIFAFVYGPDKRVIVKANVQAFDRIVKSKRPFKKGHLVAEEDIYISKMNIRKMPKSAMRNPDKIIGKSLRRSIVANIPIVEDMIEESQVVKRGKRVLLLINHNGLNITAAGEIKEKGYVGMTVRAVNISSKKEVTGTLIDANTVKVEL